MSERSRWRGTAFAAVFFAFWSSGCTVTRFASPEKLSDVRPSERLAHSFYVESARGVIRMSNGMGNVSPGAADINRLLKARYPDVFNKKSGAVPLHVEYAGTVSACGSENKEVNFLIIPFWWRYRTGGKVEVAIALDNQGKRRMVRVPYTKIQTESFLFWALVLPGEGDWPAVRGQATSTGLMEPVFADLVAAGVVKALNRMDDAELASLVAESHRTAEQKHLIEWLASGPGITVAVDGEGRAFVESEREFVPVAVDMATERALPEITAQRYDTGSRRGMVEADATGRDAGLAVDYLAGRVIPAICRTKGVVFNPGTGPAGGARFRLLSIDQGTENGKDVVRIEFESLE